MRPEFDSNIKKDKECGSGFQFTSCEQVAETCKMKRTKTLYQLTGMTIVNLLSKYSIKVFWISFYNNTFWNFWFKNIHQFDIELIEKAFTWKLY